MPTASEKDRSLDLGLALAGIEPPAERIDVSAGFFHRTLARWLGLPEGKQPGKKKAEAPLWDYDLWKAELVDEGELAGGRAYTARVFRVAASEPEHYRYWVRLDAGGRIKASGWLTKAPELFDAPRPSVPPAALSDRDLARVFEDDP